MSKMSVLKAAQHFGVSKEAIHNRVRRGSLQSVIEDGVKLVIVDETVIPIKRVTTASLNEQHFKTLEEQNKQLLEKIENLENKLNILIVKSSKPLKTTPKKIEITKEIETHKIISLKDYLKDQKISEKKVHKIKSKFKKRAETDERIIIKDKKYYLDLDKYDYRDLL